MVNIGVIKAKYLEKKTNVMKPWGLECIAQSKPQTSYNINEGF